MNSRIAPQDEIPVHIDEVGYLNDLSIAIKVLFHDIKDAHEYTLQITFVMLARWEVEHVPNLVRHNCGFNGRNLWQSRAKRKTHEEDASRIAAIIGKLMGGLKDDNPVRDITQDDIDAIAEVRKNLEECKERLVWYR